MKRNNLINSALEASLRISLILNHLNDLKFNTDEILLLDYYIIHLNNFDSNYENIHPKIPNSENELLVRHDLIIDSINILECRALITVNYTKNGVRYSANTLTAELSKCFESRYYSRLLDNIKSIDKSNLNTIFQSVKQLTDINSDLWTNKML